MRSLMPPRPRSRRRAGAVVALAGAFAAGGALASTAAPRDEQPPVPLCGITAPVDTVLRCPSATTAAAGAAPQRAAARHEEAASSASAQSAFGERQPRAVAAAPRFVADLLLVKFRRGTPPSRQSGAFAAAQVTVERRIAALGVVVVHMRPARRAAALASLRASRWVASAGKDAVYEGLETTPNDANWEAQWGLRRVGLPGVWDRARSWGNVVVAVLDTGVDVDSPDLKGALLPGFNLVSPGSRPLDDNGHGTSAAGIIAARGNNHEGIAGVCWTCSILPIKVLGADGSGDTAQVAAGVVRAADAGARVISMSLGGPAVDPTLDEAIAYAVGKGALLVAAAGNNGSPTPFYPAGNPKVISVAATDQADRLYSWSNYGPWVQTAAPGCNAAPALGGSYVSFCGTSSAAPVVAGLVALQLAQRPTAGRDEIVNALESTATPIGDGVSRGRVDATAALALPAPPAAAPAPLLDVRASLRPPRVASRSYRLPAGPGTVTATATFAPGQTLTLTIRTARGVPVATIAGASPLRLSRPLAAGRYAFGVSGRKTVGYRLVVSSGSVAPVAR
jgi:subtilisin family serine protease